MVKSDKERLSLLEQHNDYVREEFTELKEMLKEIRDSQKTHESNDIARHQEALQADRDIITNMKANYVSKEWVKTVGATVSILWAVVVFFAEDIIKTVFDK